MRRWKKWGLLILLLASLAACHKTEKTEKRHWLTGKWEIAQQNLTFEWTYQEGSLYVKQPAAKQGTWKLKEQKGTQYLFEASDGTQYHITKIDETHIKYYQSAKKGMLGLTQEVEATKRP